MKYIGIHLKAGFNYPSLFKEEISNLGIKPPQHITCSLKRRYSYDEIIEILFVLILIIIAVR